MKIDIDDDCADLIVVGMLKRTLVTATRYPGDEYYQKLKPALELVLDHYSPPSHSADKREGEQ